jgi:hypothetical protein
MEPLLCTTENKLKTKVSFILLEIYFSVLDTTKMANPPPSASPETKKHPSKVDYNGKFQQTHDNTNTVTLVQNVKCISTTNKLALSPVLPIENSTNTPHQNKKKCDCKKKYYFKHTYNTMKSDTNVKINRLASLMLYGENTALRKVSKNQITRVIKP